MEALISKYRSLLSATQAKFVRALDQKINWQARAICIEGARGTGKSTLMLQHIKARLPIDRSLYLSLDDLYFKQHTLSEVGEDFYRQEGRHLFLDEVHKYQDWQREVKNLYDFFPDLQIIVSGSSILALQQSEADLSRRMLRYHLPELSLREYVALKERKVVDAFSLKELLEEHTGIVDKIRHIIPSPLRLFKDYLNEGAYPFFLEGGGNFFMRLNQLINVIIDYDLPEARAIETGTQVKLKKLLYVLSQSVPFTPNISKLAEQIGTSRSRLLEMLDVLEKAQLIHNLRSDAFGVSLLNKPEKIYLHNTSLIMSLAEDRPNIGNLRETFFYTQLAGAGYRVNYPKAGDFQIDKKYYFEIGGKAKTNKQISELPDAYIVKDNIEYGSKQTIPLWLFGFLY